MDHFDCGARLDRRHPGCEAPSVPPSVGTPKVKTRPIQAIAAQPTKLRARPQLHVQRDESGAGRKSIRCRQTPVMASAALGARWLSASMNVVLMGRDRTSLHKTEFCVEGQGWHIDRNVSSETKVHMERPYPYDLPVMKFIATEEVPMNGSRYPSGSVCLLVRGRRRRIHRAALAAHVIM